MQITNTNNWSQNNNFPLFDYCLSAVDEDEEVRSGGSGEVTQSSHQFADFQNTTSFVDFQEKRRG